MIQHINKATDLTKAVKMGTGALETWQMQHLSSIRVPVWPSLFQSICIRRTGSYH